ncbi:MAG: sortase [Planctomycetes bacterium]|nr:sortase [Planctomycetota bacterium]
MGDITLEIPNLGVVSQILGVPQYGDGWDVTWLSNQVGYLAGTAFPTWSGNTALTAHVNLSDGTPGPFARLVELRWGDEIIIEAFGQRYTYEVRRLRYVKPDDLSVLSHEDLDWVTLITCRVYDPGQDSYLWRAAVQAVLIRVEDS